MEMLSKPWKKLFDLSGQVTVITGGRGGIGKVLASGFAAHGSDIFLMDLPPTSSIKDLGEALAKNFGIRSGSCEVDVSDPDSVTQAVETVLATMGKVDVLINAAGIIRRGSIVETTDAYWDRTIDVNLKGIFLCTRAIGPHLIEQRKGKIINIASTNGEAGVKNHVAYCSSKGGVIALSKAMAIEWAEFGINVNVLSPNVVRTDMTADRLAKPEEYQRSVLRIPMGRILEPEDLVGAALFLASPASDMVTGHVLNVDGGYMAQ